MIFEFGKEDTSLLSSSLRHKGEKLAKNFYRREARVTLCQECGALAPPVEGLGLPRAVVVFAIRLVLRERDAMSLPHMRQASSATGRRQAAALRDEATKGRINARTRGKIFARSLKKIAYGWAVVEPSEIG